MSCIRFSTPAQRRQLAATAPRMLTVEQAAIAHPAPAISESKLRRLGLLATDRNPRIRESAASSRHTPAEVLLALAHDSADGVRASVARNPATPQDALRSLLDDSSERVRGFLALNPSLPEGALTGLGSDRSRTVRELVRWRAELAHG